MFPQHPCSSQELYHGVVHLEVRIVALETEEETRCEIGLIVHPVNSAPEIAVDESRLLSATNGGLVKPHKDIHLNGVIRLWPWLCQAVVSI